MKSAKDTQEEAFSTVLQDSVFKRFATEVTNVELFIAHLRWIFALGFTIGVNHTCERLDPEPKEK